MSLFNGRSSCVLLGARRDEPPEPDMLKKGTLYLFREYNIISRIHKLMLIPECHGSFLRHVPILHCVAPHEGIRLLPLRTIGVLTLVVGLFSVL